MENNHKCIVSQRILSIQYGDQLWLCEQDKSFSNVFEKLFVITYCPSCGYKCSVNPTSKEIFSLMHTHEKLSQERIREFVNHEIDRAILKIESYIREVKKEIDDIL
jgi:hypothetical protein